MSAKMWFGTRGNMQWVPAPASDVSVSAVGWSSKQQQINGGATVRRSFAAHKEYPLVWNPNTRDALRPIMDYAQGVYGTGLIYFITPDAANKNVLPQHWAFPAQGGYDAPVLIGVDRPSLSSTPANALGYPAESATYSLLGPSSVVFVPVPTGYSAWVGVHGTSDGGDAVKITPYSSADVAQSAVYPTLLAVTSSTRVNTEFSGVGGIEISLGGGSATTVTLSGLVVQILRTGVTPAAGGFISGQGHAGSRFDEMPVQTLYTIAGLNSEVGVSARLTEVWD